MAEGQVSPSAKICPSAKVCPSAIFWPSFCHSFAIRLLPVCSPSAIHLRSHPSAIRLGFSTHYMCLLFTYIQGLNATVMTLLREKVVGITDARLDRKEKIYIAARLIH